MSLDVVDYRRLDLQPLLCAHNAMRMGFQISFARFIPGGAISSLMCRGPWCCHLHPALGYLDPNRCAERGYSEAHEPQRSEASGDPLTFMDGCDREHRTYQRTQSSRNELCAFHGCLGL
jgi:hypothetical protein